ALPISALDALAPEARDLVFRHPAEVLVEGFTCFQFFAVDQNGVRARERIAVVVEIAKERKTTVLEGGRPVFVLPMEARDEVVDEFRSRSVVADHNKTGWHPNSRLLPEIECLCVVAVQGFQGRLKLW